MDEQKEDKNIETELEKAKVQAQEYLDNWKRERADFINYKKDEVKRLSEFAKFANERVVLEVIELVDDLEKASKEIGNPGLDQVVKKFEEFLKKHNIERISTEGAFDPNLHEAIESSPTSEVGAPTEASGEAVEGESGDKTEEVRAGYTMHGKVIRPARVKIIK